MKKTLEISNEQALTLYPSATKEWKTILEENFGIEFFNPKTIFDKVKTFEDACNVKGINMFEWFDKYNNIPKHILAEMQLEIIIEVMNEGWTPNWKDSSEYKWYPYFDLGGSGFSLYGCLTRNSVSGVGVRLCTKNEDLCRYIATQFIDIYKDYMTIE